MRLVVITFVLLSTAIWATEQDQTSTAVAEVVQLEEGVMSQQQSERAELAPSGPVLELDDGGYRPLAEAEHQFVNLFRECGAQHGIDPALLAAVAAVESSFRTGVESHKGALGLMQFMPSTAKAMGVDPWNPESAICGAARYLKTSIEIHGNWDEAIAAYNAGDPAVSRKGVSAADGSYVEDVTAAWAARLNE